MSSWTIQQGRFFQEMFTKKPIAKIFVYNCTMLLQVLQTYQRPKILDRSSQQNKDYREKDATEDSTVFELGLNAALPVPLKANGDEDTRDSAYDWWGLGSFSTYPLNPAGIPGAPSYSDRDFCDMFSACSWDFETERCVSPFAQLKRAFGACLGPHNRVSCERQPDCYWMKDLRQCEPGSLCTTNFLKTGSPEGSIESNCTEAAVKPDSPCEQECVGEAVSFTKDVKLQTQKCISQGSGGAFSWSVINSTATKKPDNTIGIGSTVQARDYLSTLPPTDPPRTIPNQGPGSALSVDVTYLVFMPGTTKLAGPFFSYDRSADNVKATLVRIGSKGTVRGKRFC